MQDTNALIHTAPGAAAPLAKGNDDKPRLVPRTLSNRQKAAIVVRLLLSEGADLPLEELPDDLQEKLTHQLGEMGLVDRVTLDAVAQEFGEALDNIGLAFPHGLAGALDAVTGKIAPKTAARLRKVAGIRQVGDPWQRLRDIPVEDLAAMAQAESTEVAAVMLSKMDTAQAAQMLGQMPGPVARRITFAVSKTANVTPEAVERIGWSLAAQLDQRPVQAFDDGPSARVGAILNQSAAATRDDLLNALDEDDAAFAELVRQSIFTFAHISNRITARDVPAILREVDQAVLVTALAGAAADDDKASVEFLLTNISSRMAENLREEMGERGRVKQSEAEEAMTQVVGAIRTLVDAGTIALVETEEEAE
ncbi:MULTISPECIES: flagellar motor switch protein FliG [unclassified Ruegeria]|uniref:flagellar motor switch protein FliG n=1 Tax=unclassified Ruegeria TaxID=2625375 RepID=UPI0014888608|nr:MULTISPECIES: FliG C-terminal domain-containing protein [unclassified Ruegeria]NOD46640.1 flagellar motor switch protein FliG [Ruegeria sp. HKCCD5849]NOD50060.1 flagellar motor switch protein FliG [Ruegeria sp. HKCCD5851]NOD66894.1 flagellar motor switch protein FliG [Ruegeria sp. HKCCD7303]NOE32459.1 flagellar motor switch protein FliG [Ruegeria sp. HKCCD7318]